MILDIESVKKEVRCFCLKLLLLEVVTIMLGSGLIYSQTS
jgi:hypothetical protein